MEQLAEAAGVSVRTLYRLFGSRAALLRELGWSSPPSTREQILAAALELVGRGGLAALSMDELAEAAGVSRATLYRLFPGKSALFDGLIRTYAPWEAVADTLEALPSAPPAEVVPALARAIADTMEGRAALLLQMVFELLKGDPDTLAGARHTMDRGLPDLIRYLESEMAAGRLRRMHPVVAAQLLAGPILAHQLTRPLGSYVRDFPPVSDDVIDEIAEAWLRALAP